jgi:hypothetical protein
MLARDMQWIIDALTWIEYLAEETSNVRLAHYAKDALAEAISCQNKSLLRHDEWIASIIHDLKASTGEELREDLDPRIHQPSSSSGGDQTQYPSAPNVVLLSNYRN